MEKVRIIDNGVEKKVEYTDKLANGIFLVDDKKTVKKNCEILSIKIDELNKPLELIQKVTKLEKTGVLTIKFDEQNYFQYIIKDYASKEDVERLINMMPLQSREALRAAYNYTKINTFNDLDLLGGAMENKN